MFLFTENMSILDERISSLPLSRKYLQAFLKLVKFFIGKYSSIFFHIFGSPTNLSSKNLLSFVNLTKFSEARSDGLEGSFGTSEISGELAAVEAFSSPHPFDLMRKRVA